MKHLLALCGLAALYLLAGIASAAPPPLGRVFHVSVGPLPGVAAAVQFRTIGEAAKLVQPGDTVLIHTGVYRETVTVGVSGTPARPIRFETAPAANAVVTGADILTGWQKEPGTDNIFSVAWPYSFLWAPLHAHPDDDYHVLIGRVEQVFVQNYLLHQVLHRDQMSRGSFYVDQDAKKLYAWDMGNQDLNGVPAEASVRDTLWRCTGDYVQVRGIRFRYAANMAQQGSGQFTGRGDVIQDCIFERTNGSGASFTGPDQLVQRCTFQENGQIGFSAVHAHNFHFSDCLVQNNNIKDFSRGWEAGADKFVLSRGVVVDHCRFLNNRGSGLWFDLGNENCEVSHCLIADNEDGGIFYEISYGLHAHDNVIVGNGFAASPGGWGAQAGICLSSSPNGVIERNLLVGNKEGFNFREQGRTTPRIDGKPGDKEAAVWNHDQTIRHNVIADNRDAQTWGWFDIWDEHQWPKKMQMFNFHERPGYIPVADFARGYQANQDAGQPIGQSLDRMHIVFADNLYDTPDGQPLFRWGTPWLHHAYYDDLASVRRELAMEQRSVVAPFRVGDFLTHDFRVPANSPALKMGCYPLGDVPEVKLGIAR